jgi:multicomponent Na+:H+ antiporter subunit B
MMSELLIPFLFLLLAVIAVAVARQGDLFTAVMLTGIYSLVSASLFVVLDAVDVAFTEAAVGAGISTILMLGAMQLAGREAKPAQRSNALPLLAAIGTGAALIYGTLDFPAFADASDPIHHHVAPHYIKASAEEIGVPNIVTSVLASYRGYDTMGELAVIFTSGIGVLLLLRRDRREDET